MLLKNKCLDRSSRGDYTGMWDTFWFVAASSIFQIPVVIVPSLWHVNNRPKLTEQTISQIVDQFQKFCCEPPCRDIYIYQDLQSPVAFIEQVKYIRHKKEMTSDVKFRREILICVRESSRTTL